MVAPIILAGGMLLSGLLGGLFGRGKDNSAALQRQLELQRIAAAKQHNDFLKTQMEDRDRSQKAIEEMNAKHTEVFDAMKQAQADEIEKANAIQAQERQKQARLKAEEQDAHDGMLQDNEVAGVARKKKRQDELENGMARMFGVESVGSAGL